MSLSHEKERVMKMLGEFQAIIIRKNRLDAEYSNHIKTLLKPDKTGTTPLGRVFKAESKMSLRSAAQFLQVSPTYLCNVLKGQTRPTQNTVLKIILFLTGGQDSA